MMSDINKENHVFLYALLMATALFLVQLISSGVVDHDTVEKKSGAFGFIFTVIASLSFFKFDGSKTLDQDKKSRGLNLLATIFWLTGGFISEKGRFHGGSIDKAYWILSVIALILLILSSLICLSVRTKYGMEIYKRVLGENGNAFLNYSLKRFLVLLSLPCVLVCCGIQTYHVIAWRSLGLPARMYAMLVIQWASSVLIGLAWFLHQDLKEDDGVGGSNAGGNNSGNVRTGPIQATAPTIEENPPAPAYQSSSVNFGTGAVNMDKYGSGLTNMDKYGSSNNYGSAFEWGNFGNNK